MRCFTGFCQFSQNIWNKTLYLTNLESSDVIGGKVEIQADFLSVGKAKAQMAEAIVNRLLTLSSVVSAGWELV